MGPNSITLALLASWVLSTPVAGGEATLGTDSRGIPLACGTGDPSAFEVRAGGSGGAAGLPAGTRGWECIPGAIFADGAGSFRVEVDANGPVSRVSLRVYSFYLMPALNTIVELLDDGQGEDRKAWVPVTRFFGEGVTWKSEVPLTTFIRGDANGDGSVDLSDAVFILFALFAQPQDPRCPDALDSNDDGAVDLSDAVRLLETLFLGGAPLPLPYPGAGIDPTLDLLACLR
jgi:dockerin type I repeat protein